MKKTCLVSGQEFDVNDSDLSFYELAAPGITGERFPIPTPTLAPAERRRRRFSHRNERRLYRRSCGLSGKTVISNYGSHNSIPVYEQGAWWSDGWDAKEYAREFDFSRTFFEQYAELQAVVPQLALSVWNSENSEYCNYVGHVKDSYLIFGSVYSEDCYYGSPYYSKDCLDTLVVRECESCYECIDCRKLYGCMWCQDCHSSNDLIYCYDLLGCSDCIACAGLRKQQYHIFNEPHSKDDYLAFKSKLNYCDPESHAMLRKKLRELKAAVPHRYMQSNQVENASGNYVYEARNTLDSFYADRCEDSRYCAQVVDLKNCHDNNFTEENELCYEYLGAYQNSRMVFSKFCNRVSDSMYCDSCFISNNLFGCIGLRHSSCAILNQEYSKDEYCSLAKKLISHMRDTGEWGEFFPIEISPFGYNETVASEYFPLPEEEARSRGFQWTPLDDSLTEVKSVLAADSIPRDITDVPDDIISSAVVCDLTGRPFRILKQELDFYRQQSIPIPRLHPDERHRSRMMQRNPQELWRRECAKCSLEFETTYAPSRPEAVYCERCYLDTVY